MKTTQMLSDANKHVRRTAEDIDKGVKLRNNYAVDSSQKNLKDKEGLIDELIKLEKELTTLKVEEIASGRNTKKLLEQAGEMNKEINTVISDGKIVEVGRGQGGLRKFELVRDSNDIALIEREIMRMRVEENKKNPLDDLVLRIEDMGVSLQFVFKEIDSNADELLTMLEIKKGFEELDIYVSGTELQELQKALDDNGDGVVTLEEFVKILKPQVEVRQEFKKIMQNVKIDDPIELEEKILDLQFRSRALNKAVQEKRIQFGVPASKVKTNKDMRRNPIETMLA